MKDVLKLCHGALLKLLDVGRSKILRRRLISKLSNSLLFEGYGLPTCLKGVMKFVAIPLKTCTLKGKQVRGVFIAPAHKFIRNMLFKKSRGPDLK